MTTALWTKLPVMAAKLAALDQAPMATLWVDEEGIIGYVNHRFCETMGYAQDDLAGARLDRMLPGVDLGQWQQEWWQIIVSERYLPLFPLTWRHAKGITLEYTASASLVEVSGLQFAVFYLWPRHSVCSEPDAFPVNDATFYLRSLGESVCLLDSLGIIRFANTAFCKLVGGSEADLIGLPLLEIVSPAKSHLIGVWEVLQLKRSSTEYEFKNLAGKSLNIRINVVKLPGNQANNSRYLVSIIDITDQIEIARQLEAQNASYDRLAANIPGFIYKFRMTKKGEFSFPYASRGCQDIFGVDPVTVSNDATPILQTIHPDDLPMFQESVMTSAMHLTPWNIEARQKTSDGDWKWFHAASRPQLQENGDIIWEGLVMDVTTRKLVEEELAKAKLAADASASAKAEFLANMSHEIRTPLNAIIGLNRLVLKSDLAPAQRDYLTKVQLSSENLLAIINNILDFSKIESGKLVTENIEFNLDAVLENIGSMLEPVAAEKHLDLLIDRSIGVPLYMIGDSLRLVQVLTNLCSNAIKFTEQGEVIITVERVSNNDEDGLRFSVKDTGIGLSEQQKDRIFESFTQADSSTTRHHGGTGLGLTISKHLTELMGGEIGVSSVENAGSEFYFTLPLNVLPDTQPASSIPAELEGWHVLLIMENETACSIFEKMLRDLRFKVTVCSLRTMNLEKILKNQDQLEQVQHELVLLDWKMHESHKQSVTHAMENNVFGAKTPIIVNVSTYEAESIRNLSDKFVNLTFLTKPSTPSCLMDAILNACGKDAMIQAVQADHDSKNLAFYEASVRGIRVLIVEDNEINQIVVRKTLESAEVIVDVANNGSEAVDRLQNAPDRHYDAVLMDLQMPHMDGFEATTILRNNKRFDALPIIAMTAHTLENDKQKCLDTGMQDHVSKPIVPEQLFSKLAKWTISRFQNGQDTTAIPNLAIETEAPMAQKSLQDLTTVDVNSALHLLQGDQSLLQQLLLNFSDELSDAPKHLRALLDEDEWGRAADKAHQIKGVAGNLQITGVFEMSRKLEMVLRNHENNVAEKVLGDFTAAIDAFIEETDLCRIMELPVENEITGVDAILLKDADFDELVTLFDKLIDFLEMNNWHAEDYLEQVSLCLGEAHMQEIKQIKNHLTALEFEAAADRVRKLRERLHSVSV